MSFINNDAIITERDWKVLRMLLEGKDSFTICKKNKITSQRLSQIKSKLRGNKLLNEWYIDPHNLGFKEKVFVLIRTNEEIRATHINLTKSADKYFLKECKQLTEFHDIMHTDYDKLAVFLVRDLNEFHEIEKKILKQYRVLFRRWIPLKISHNIKEKNPIDLIDLKIKSKI